MLLKEESNDGFSVKSQLVVGNPGIQKDPTSIGCQIRTFDCLNLLQTVSLGCCYSGRLVNCKLFVENTENKYLKVTASKAPLHIATEKGHLKLIVRIIRNKNLETPLHIAAYSGLNEGAY